MEVPPGRVERISDAGQLRAMKFNGILKTSVLRGDTPLARIKEGLKRIR